MSELITRDIEYALGDVRMIGYLAAPATSRPLPGILLIHDAFGVTDDHLATARQYAGLGFAVFAADVWGERGRPKDASEIGPFIGGMVGDRPQWLARIAAAHSTLAGQPEADASAIAAVGYCFGGSSALEYLRTGAALRGVVGIHAGLDLLDPDWSVFTSPAPTPPAPTSPAHVLLCTGADDPMATTEMRESLQRSLSGAGIDWEVDLYSDTKHAFTSPQAASAPANDVFAYNERSAARAWQATTRFLGELFA